MRQTKVFEMQMDLEHNAYNEHLEFNRELVVGIVSFLLLDVKQPSPSLFLNDPKTYTEQVQHAGMQAALGYLRCAQSQPIPVVAPLATGGIQASACMQG